jgi:hypothetical protein
MIGEGPIAPSNDRTATDVMNHAIELAALALGDFCR